MKSNKTKNIKINRMTVAQLAGAFNKAMSNQSGQSSRYTTEIQTELSARKQS